MSGKYLPYQSDFLNTIYDIKTLFCMVAMDSEEDALLAGHAYTVKEFGRRKKITVKEFNLPHCKVIVGRSGVGLVNAGVLFTMVAEEYPIDAAILLGVGGALDEELNAGDTVIARQVLQHDSMSTLDIGNLFIAPGTYTLSADENNQIDPVIRCDQILVRWVEQVLKNNQYSLFQGSILSGSEFAGRTDRKKYLRSLKEDALLVDMEAGAIAQIARSLKIPFVAVKTVSDRVKPDSSIADDYKVFLKSAADTSAAVFKGLLSTFK